MIVLAVIVFLSGAPSAANSELLWRHRNLGKALFETPTKEKEAVVELKQALDLAPNSFRERLNYGLALLRAGDVESAIPQLQTAQKLNPRLPHTWFNLGIAYKREKRYPDAIRQFERMAQLAPDEPVTHYNLGLLYNLIGRKADALKQFETSAALDANLVAPRYQIYNYYRLEEKEDEADKALASFQNAKKAKGDESEDMEWCPYAELYDPIQAPPAGRDASPAAQVKFRDDKLAGTADPQTAGLLVVDAFGEGKADLLGWSRDGLRLYRNGRQEIADTGLEGLTDVIGAAAGDFDNDGLADLCILTESGPLLYRNLKGRFEKKQTSLPAGRFEEAVWLDFDHDNDLDLFLLGQRSVLLRNENGSFGDYTEHFPFANGRAIAAATLRVVPDTKAMDLAVSYLDLRGVLYLNRMGGVFQAAALDALPPGARSLHAMDVDNDSWIDLGFTSPGGTSVAANRKGKFETAGTPAPAATSIAFADLENRGFPDLVAGNAIYRNQGLTRLAPGKAAAGLISAVAWATADFDGDGKVDLAAVAPDGSLHLLTNESTTRNQWLRVALTGVKNVKTAVGAEVEVKAGDLYQKKVYTGVPLPFGLGPRPEVETVRITWPNGQIQNQTKEAASRAVPYLEAPRMSGSCPMVFTWNGAGFQFISDVLGVAPLGASAGDGQYFPVDNDEYIQLPPGAIAPRAGRFEVRIAEELHEVSYIDQTRLIAVDHPSQIEIFTNDKFKAPPFPEFRLFGVKRRIYPEAARDGNGRDALAAVFRRDRVYAAGFRHNSAGVAEMHALELKFPKAAARENRAVLILNGWIDWADGSTFLAASQGGKGGLVMPYLQVKDASGNWRTVIEDMGVPSGGPKTIAVDLTGKFLSDSREVRILTNVCVYWDEIFLSEETAAPAVRMTVVDAAGADLRLHGFSKVLVDANREQPERYDYARWQPSAMWNPVPGLYTRYGDVKDLVRATDDQFVIMGSGDESAALLRRTAPAAAPKRLATRFPAPGRRLVKRR